MAAQEVIMFTVSEWIKKFGNWDGKLRDRDERKEKYVYSWPVTKDSRHIMNIYLPTLEIAKEICVSFPPT